MRHQVKLPRLGDTTQVGTSHRVAVRGRLRGQMWGRH